MDSQQNKGFKCFFHKTHASILCIPLRTTNVHVSISKRNYILATNKVHPIVRINFDSQQNKGLKSFLSEKKNINIMYLNMNYLFVLVRQENKLDSWHERSLSRFKDKLWFPTKWRVEMVFKWNQSINIMYSNDNYPFSCFCHEKKLDSCHERSLSHFKNEL